MSQIEVEGESVYLFFYDHNKLESVTHIRRMFRFEVNVNEKRENMKC